MYLLVRVLSVSSLTALLITAQRGEGDKAEQKRYVRKFQNYFMPFGQTVLARKDTLLFFSTLLSNNLMTEIKNVKKLSVVCPRTIDGSSDDPHDEIRTITTNNCNDLFVAAVETRLCWREMKLVCDICLMRHVP